MTPTHEMWNKGKLYKLFSVKGDTVLNLDGTVYLTGVFTKEDLEYFGYELKEIVINLENE